MSMFHADLFQMCKALKLEKQILYNHKPILTKNNLSIKIGIKVGHVESNPLNPNPDCSDGQDFD